MCHILHAQLSPSNERPLVEPAIEPRGQIRRRIASTQDHVRIQSPQRAHHAMVNMQRYFGARQLHMEARQHVALERGRSERPISILLPLRHQQDVQPIDTLPDGFEQGDAIGSQNIRDHCQIHVILPVSGRAAATYVRHGRTDRGYLRCRTRRCVATFFCRSRSAKGR